ncbi:MAG: energy transducer TonB [Gammaproteobacteria bacterium]|nr:energy transducer TonB [Gammaproteobacteria bacterium]
MSEPVSVELYTAPVRKNMELPRYPRLAQSKGMEGWVRLDFMVGTDGKAFEIAVTDSMGNANFQGAAIRALRKSTFEPAHLNGQPVDAGYAMYYRFEVEGEGGGVGRGFLHLSRALMRAVDQDDRPLADRELAALESRTGFNLYEDAYLHIAKYRYYARWGDAPQQLDALDRAVSQDFQEHRLPEELYVALQIQRFWLLVKTQDYERAASVFETLGKYELEASVTSVLEATMKVPHDRRLTAPPAARPNSLPMEQPPPVAGAPGDGCSMRGIRALREDDRAYAVTGSIAEHASWFYHLLKDEFAVTDIQGEITEVKLRCPESYVFFRFDPDLEYRVSNKRGHCHLELVGNPGTTFKLVQM